MCNSVKVYCKSKEANQDVANYKFVKNEGPGWPLFNADVKSEKVLVEKAWKYCQNGSKHVPIYGLVVGVDAFEDSAEPNHNTNCNNRASDKWRKNYQKIVIVVLVS